MGADPNLHPLLVATSILPSVGVSFAPIQVFAPVDPLRVGYATPLTPVSSSPIISNLLQPTSVSAIATTQMIAAALMTPTANTLAQPVPTASLSAAVAAPIHPATPILQLAASSDTGASSSDKITKITTPTITGTGDIGTKIKLSDGNTVVGQTTVAKLAQRAKNV